MDEEASLEVVTVVEDDTVMIQIQSMVRKISSLWSREEIEQCANQRECKGLQVFVVQKYSLKWMLGAKG